MKKITAIILALLLTLSICPAALYASAEESNRADVTWTAGSTASGALSNLSDGNASTRVDFNDWSTASAKSTSYYWKLEDGVLSVVGNGSLLSTSSTAYAGFPWYTRGEEIETVILIGFDTIGTGAFYSPQNSLSYRNVKKFIIGEGTTTLNDSAFGIYSGKLNNNVDIYLPSSLTTINSRAFRSIANYIGTVYASPALDVAALTVSASNNPAKITGKDYTTADYTHLLATAYEWENNNGCTELVVGLTDMRGELPVAEEELQNYTWKVSISSHDFGKTIECAPSYVNDGKYYFRTCLAEGEDQFIPKNYLVSKTLTANDYSVQINICDKTTGDPVFCSEYKNGYVFPTSIEAIYPEDHAGLWYFNGEIYLEGDLGGEYLLDTIEVYTYRAGNRYYQFRVVASNDNTLPASAWTFIGAQSANVASTNSGYTVSSGDSANKYRYVRIYPVGNYGAGGNSGFHFTDVFVNIKPGEVYVDPYEQFGGTSKRLSTAAFHSVGFETWPYADNGVWSDRAFFQAVMTINGSEADFKANYGTDAYEYVWNVYARDTANEASGWDGPFTAPMETMNNGNVYYRVQVSNCPQGDLCADFEIGHTYEIVFDVLKDGEHEGFALLTVKWTQKHQDQHDLYIDFWNNHDRLDGYTAGSQVVTDRDAAVANALGFTDTGAYAAKAHTHVFADATVPATCVTTEKEASVCTVCGMIGKVYSENPDAYPAHKLDDGTVTVCPTFTDDGTIEYTCAYCSDKITSDVPAAESGVTDAAIVGKKDDKNTVTIIGTIIGKYIDEESADKITMTVEFQKDGAPVKTKKATINGIYTTLEGVATVSEMTAAGQQDILLVEADYIFGVTVVGIPAGDYTATVTVEAILAGVQVSSAEAVISFTVE